ncbi:hypothetical protein FGO68_gene10068 [Halteria grandinella]|uniref:Uncharacterized protein n=1 Tax=Halteria grandinella TaxID=5974 RepID=A0A8J8SVC3_HALGN|nr:hypothetical protein FGO68_gene10068 [Halteria grandinella]
MCNEELSTNLPTLTNTLFVLSPLEGKTIPDLPVAFATNSLYVLEKHGLGDVARDTYSKLLIPILKAKAQNLHAEGVAQAVWALANAGLVEDAELWGTLKKAALDKQWTQVIVKNERWSATLFRTQAGNEHFFEGELNEFADQLFFQDHLNLFEAYNGFKKAAALNPKLGLEEVVKAFESKYGDVILRRNDAYLEIAAVAAPAVKQLAGAHAI